MVKSDKQTAGEGAAYISLQVISSLASGYIFWVILSRITTTEIIGTFSLIVSLADIFANIAIIGIPNGVQRFLGKSFAEHELYDARVVLKASLFLLSIGILVCSIFILIAGNWIYQIFKIDFVLIVLVIFLVGSSCIYTLFYSVVVASLRTRVLPQIGIICSGAKILLAMFLVLMGWGVVGLTIGYTLFGQVLSSILLAIVIVTLFKSSSAKQKEKEKEKKVEVTFRSVSKNLLVASVASWVPVLIPTIGTDLGTLVLFGSQGSNQAGVYFIALTISTGITSITYSIFTVALPALSAMQDGRKRFAWHTIRLSAIFSIPFSSSLIFYSKDIMQLIGQAYTEGSLSLQILMSSMLPTTVLTGIETLVYSYGSYRRVLAIGLAMNIPRTILYFVLVPIYGSTGAAISYTVGSLIGFAFSIFIARGIGMQIFWRFLAFTFIVPIGIGFLLHYFQVNFIIGIVSTIIISFLLLLKLRILTKSDVLDSIGILPYSISNPVIRFLNVLDKKLNRFY